MSEFNPDNDAAASSSADLVPQWGSHAPSGGKAVVNRALKDGSTVPLFLGQTLINSLRDLGYNSTTSAICEHVDNAIEADASEVRIFFRQTGKQPNQRIDVLVYDNGRGMSPNVLKVAMAFGGSMRFDNRSGIGRYGMGMKAAALNIAKSFDVYSWQEPGAYYSMTLDVEAIGKDRKDMIALPDPQLCDELPSPISSIFFKPMGFPKGETADLFAEDADTLNDRLGKSGTIIYMAECDRLSKSTERGLVDHATKEMGRIYRRFLDKGIQIYINNRRLEAFDPTFWMKSARNCQIEGVPESRSHLVDSFTMQIPMDEGVLNTTEVRVRMFQLPVVAWSTLPRDTLKNKLHVFEDHFVSYMRNGREVEIGAEPRLNVKKHTTNYWTRVEIEFSADADEAFGIAANKQGVRLKQYVADAIKGHDEGRFSRVFSEIHQKTRTDQVKVAMAKGAGQTSEAERVATEADGLQAIALTPLPTDTPEQVAAIEANLRGLASALRLENETDEQAFERVKASKYLTDIKHSEYAPFYETEHKYGKIILRINSAHPFYRMVWQPLGDLAKKSISSVVGEESDGGLEIGEASKKALLGLQLMLLSLARAHAQMTQGDGQSEQSILFRNLRKAWSDVLETQFHLL